MRPYVVVHSAVSVDGKITGFVPDMGQYYGVVSTWNEDATLVGSSTLLVPEENLPPDDWDNGEEGEEELPQAEGQEGAVGKDTSELPLLVVPDSKGQIRNWESLRNSGYWRDVLVLCSENTPKSYLEFLDLISVEYFVCGKEHVDMQVALNELKAHRSINVVRVDSGGTLVGILLRNDLVDEVSIVVHPTLVGGTTENSMFRALEGEEIPMKLTHLEKMENGLVWVRYKKK